MAETVHIQTELEEIAKNYAVLLNFPQPEEEEQVHDNFIKIFTIIQEKLPTDSNLSPIISNLLELSKKWDPLEFWFTELKELPNALFQFLNKIYPNRFSNSKSPLSKQNALFDTLNPRSSSSVKPPTLNEKMEDTEPNEEYIEMFEEEELDSQTKKRIAKRLEQIESRMASVFQKSQTNNHQSQNETTSSPPKVKPPTYMKIETTSETMPSASNVESLKDVKIQMRHHNFSQSANQQNEESNLQTASESSTNSQKLSRLHAPKVSFMSSQQQIPIKLGESKSKIPENSLKAPKIDTQPINPFITSSKEEGKTKATIPKSKGESEPIGRIPLKFIKFEQNVQDDALLAKKIKELRNFNPRNYQKKKSP